MKGGEQKPGIKVVAGKKFKVMKNSTGG